MKKEHVVEIVRWHAKESVADDIMRQAVTGILPDLETLPGFVSQVLYKDDDGRWADLYIWDTKEQAVASNDLMAQKQSFIQLMNLIDPESVSIEFLDQPG